MFAQIWKSQTDKRKPQKFCRQMKGRPKTKKHTQQKTNPKRKGIDGWKCHKLTWWNPWNETPPPTTAATWVHLDIGG